jgi:hypothetical protein
MLSFCDWEPLHTLAAMAAGICACESKSSACVWPFQTALNDSLLNKTVTPVLLSQMRPSRRSKSHPACRDYQCREHALQGLCSFFFCLAPRKALPPAFKSRHSHDRLDAPALDGLLEGLLKALRADDNGATRHGWKTEANPSRLFFQDAPDCTSPGAPSRSLCCA